MRKILLIQNNPERMREFVHGFAQAGYVVSTSPGGRPAIVSAHEFRPDAVVMDLEGQPREAITEMLEVSRTIGWVHRVPVAVHGAPAWASDELARSATPGVTAVPAWARSGASLVRAVRDLID